MTKRLVTEQSKCCGCTACFSICPKNAIRMSFDEKGFLYPYVDENKCINCNLCKEVCAFSKPLIKNNDYELMVLKHKSDDVVNESRSGGAFTAFTDYILELGGIVCGASLDNDWFVRHHCGNTSQERNSFRKSKYVQSDLNECFKEIKAYLKNGKTVFFSGTACQCDGLLSYLNLSHVNIDNLFLCDIICHSVASPVVFRKYIDYYEKKMNKKIVKYDFRDKIKHKWGSHVECIEFENGEIIYTDEYTNLFFSDDIRYSCFNCKYTSTSRVSDITIGDCWGGEKIYPDLVNESGANLVFLNTQKGKQLFENIEKKVVHRPIELKFVYQTHLKQSEKQNASFETFWADYKKLPFASFLRKYSINHYSTINRLKSRLKFIIKLPFKIINYIKKIKQQKRNSTKI